MTNRPRTSARAEPRDIAELRQLKARQPELTPAVDLQIAIVEMHRRVQARVPLPRLSPDRPWLAAQVRASRALVRFTDIPLDWTDLRLTLRQTGDILRRFDIIDSSDQTAVATLVRDGEKLEPLVRQWYLVTSRFDETVPRADALAGAPSSLEQVLVLAIRPFLAQAPHALADAVDLSAWTAGYCPYCGWEPEFAVLAGAGDRLVCGRCSADWPGDPTSCPFCRNTDRAQLTSLATPDGQYRVTACNRCRRYLKAYEQKPGGRPLLLAYDTIATLPLDAAVQQRGYTSEG